MQQNSTDNKPKIRVIHHLARSGGTIISKCIGCMRGITLLSEIHPIGASYFTNFVPHPLQQAHQWFQLLTDGDLLAINLSDEITFLESIELIYERCLSQGKILVIRDWTHLDYTAVPFVNKPTYQLTTAEVLKNRFEVIQAITVRHPVDQWLSLRKLALLQNKITLEDFLKGYRYFAQESKNIQCLRYEDFTHRPETEIQKLCNFLEVPYDPDFINQWMNYRQITGDTKGRANRTKSQIRPLPRQNIEPELLERFANNSDYLQSLSILGYEHSQ